MSGDFKLIRDCEQARLRHDPRRLTGSLDPLCTHRQLPGQRKPFGRRTPVQAALRSGPQTVGEAVDSGRQLSRFKHSATLRATPALLPIRERSGTVA